MRLASFALERLIRQTCFLSSPDSRPILGREFHRRHEDEACKTVGVELEPSIIVLADRILNCLPVPDGADSGPLVEGPVEFVMSQLVSKLKRNLR